MSEQDLRGIIPPVITPMSSERAIDEGSFKRHVTHLLDVGVHGLWVNGSTGEYHALGHAERFLCRRSADAADRGGTASTRYRGDPIIEQLEQTGAGAA